MQSSTSCVVCGLPLHSPCHRHNDEEEDGDKAAASPAAEPALLRTLLLRWTATGQRWLARCLRPRPRVPASPSSMLTASVASTARPLLSLSSFPLLHLTSKLRPRTFMCRRRIPRSGKVLPNYLRFFLPMYWRVRAMLPRRIEWCGVTAMSTRSSTMQYSTARTPTASLDMGINGH